MHANATPTLFRVPQASRLVPFVFGFWVASACAAPDQVQCDSMLKTLSAQEMTARRDYFQAPTSTSAKSMQVAADSFESYALRCGLGPMRFLGLLIHGRLAVLHRRAGNLPGALAAEELAIGYASRRTDVKQTWAQVETIIEQTDVKQRALN
jgi:hypothetical protein